MKMLFRPILRHIGEKSTKTCSRSLFWWGHDTVEDQEKRIKDKEEKKILKFDPNTQDGEIAELQREVFYAPARIKCMSIFDTIQ